MTACARAGLWGGMTKAAGRKTPTCAETVRRLEHPHRQELDDQNAAGMKPRCPAPPDWSILHLQDNRTSFFLYIYAINNNGKCLLRSGRFSVHQSRRTQTEYALPTSRLPPSYEVSTRHCGQVVWRRELSRSALAGRHSRPDRREGCQAPCPPILRHIIPLPDRGATAPQGRKTGERG